MAHGKFEARGPEHRERVAKHGKLPIGYRTRRVARVGEERACALDLEPRRVVQSCGRLFQVRWRNSEARRARIDFKMNPKACPARRDCRMIERLDEREIEDRRRQIESNNLRGLIG